MQTNQATPVATGVGFCFILRKWLA